MTWLLLLMVGGQRFSNLRAGTGPALLVLLVVIVEKSIGGLSQRAVDGPLTGRWESIGGEGGGGGGGWGWWRPWRLLLVLRGSGVAEGGLGLHAVVGDRHPLTVSLTIN